MAKEKQPYTVLDRLDYDQRYEKGDTVELDDKSAAELLRIGVVAKAEPEQQEKEAKHKK